MLTVAQLAEKADVSPATIRSWEKRGLMVGTPGYERVVFLTGRTLDDLHEFLRRASAHPSMRLVRSSLLTAALRGGSAPIVSRPVVASMFFLIVCCFVPVQSSAVTNLETSMNNGYAARQTASVRKCGPSAHSVRLTSHEAVALATPTGALKARWASIFGVSESSVQKWARSPYRGGRKNPADKLLTAMSASFRAGVPLEDAYAPVELLAQKMGRSLVPFGGAIATDDLMESFARTSAEFADVSNELASSVSENSPGGRAVRPGEARAVIREIREARQWLANLEFALVTAAERAA